MVKRAILHPEQFKKKVRELAQSSFVEACADGPALKAATEKSLDLPREVNEEYKRLYASQLAWKQLAMKADSRIGLVRERAQDLQEEISEAITAQMDADDPTVAEYVANVKAGTATDFSEQGRL